MPHNLIAFSRRCFRDLLTMGNGRTWARGLLRTVLVLWIALLLVVTIRGYFSPRKNSVFPAYYQAGQHFAQRSDLYHQQDKAQGIDVFRYSPAFAAVMVPWTWLPENRAGALWRIGQGALLLGSLCLFCMMGILRYQATFRSLTSFRPQEMPAPERNSERAILSITIFLAVSFLLSISSLNNAQLNPVLTACCFLSVLLAWKGRWGWAGCLLAIPVFIKIFPFSLFLLVALIGPLRFSFAFFAVLGGLFLAPFVMAPTDFVLSQYREWWAFLGNDDRHFWPLEAGYRDLWMVLRVAELGVPVWAYQILQVILAGFAALLVLSAFWKWGRSEALETALVTGVLWMILCGPSTESSTYTLLGPVAGMLLAGAFQKGQGLAFRCLTATGSFLLLGGVLTGLFPRGASIQALGIQPVGAICLGAGYLVFWMKRFVQPSIAFSGAAARMRELEVTGSSMAHVGQQADSWQRRGRLPNHAETPA